MPTTTNPRQSPASPDSPRGARPSPTGDVRPLHQRPGEQLPVFATGRLLGGSPEDIRQAVVTRRSRSGKGYDAIGESGDRYIFAPDWLHVPLPNLWGSTLDFAVAQGVRR